MTRNYKGPSALVVASLFSVLVATPPLAHAIAAPDAPGFAANSVKLIVDNDYAAFYGSDSNVTRILNQNNVDWSTQIANASSITISPNAGETYLYVAVMGGGGTEDFGGLLAGQDIIFISGAQVASGRSPLGSAILSSPYLKLQSYVSGYSSSAAAAGTQNVTVAQMQTALTGVSWSSAVGTTAGAGNVPNYKTSGVCCGTAATGAGLSGKGWNFPSDSLVMFRYPLTSLGVPAIGSDRKVFLDWVAPAAGTAVESYQVEYKQSSEADSAYQIFSRPISTSTSETVTGLINGVNYTFRVAALNSGGMSPYAASKSATPYGPGVSAPSITGTIKKGVSTTLTVNQSFAGKARFFVDGKKIPNCLNVIASGTAPNFTASCTFKPAWSGQVTIKAFITSSDANYPSTYSDTRVVSIYRRSNLR